MARGAEWLRWRWYPKMHMMLHLTGGQAARLGNPWSSWNYTDEGAIGIASDVAESVHVNTLPRAVMDKYLVWATMQH